MRNCILQFLGESSLMRNDEASCRHKHPLTGLISVCRDDGVFCVFTLFLNLALFNLIVVINKRALNVFSYSSTVESLHYLRVWIYFGLLHRCFENEQVLLEYRGGFGFLFVCCIYWNVLCGIYLGMNVSGEVCGEVVSRSLMSKSAAFLSKLTNVKMYKHRRGVNAYVFFLTCSLEANPSSSDAGH